MNIGIIGSGNIGSELHKKVRQLVDWNIRFVLRSKGVYKNLEEKIDAAENYQKYADQLDIVFLTIPTLDDGKIAFNYLSFYLSKNIPVVTCEKGALSNYFSELERWIDCIGYSATVGGGTRLLRYVEEMASNNTQEIHAVINGTLNYIFDEISRGRTLGEVVSEARKLGYAEPGAKDPLDIINKEVIGDIPMKASILFNVCGLSDKRVRAKDIRTNYIKEENLVRLIRESDKRRYIVSLTKDNANQNNNIGGFSHQIGEWTISGGFKDISADPLFIELVPMGVNNAVVVCEGKYGADGIYKLSGQGAGAGPTTYSMIKDAFRLITK